MPNSYLSAGALPWRHWDLIWQFSRRDVLSRYRGSWLGLGWTVLTPLLMLAVYTVVFRFVFHAKWPQSTNESNLDFALNLYAGLIIFNWTAELLARAPRLFLEQPNLITKVVFPLPILGWSSLVASFFQTMISCLIWLLACWAGGHQPTFSWLLVPLVFAGFASWLLGMTWLLSSLGVYLRDLSQLVSLSLTGLLFLSPVFYPVSSLPEWLASIAHLNPLTVPIEILRAAVLGFAMPPTDGLLIALGGSLFCFCVGLSVLMRIKDGFADVV